MLAAAAELSATIVPLRRPNPIQRDLMNSSDLRVGIVTGASRGIGAAVAQRLAKDSIAIIAGMEPLADSVGYPSRWPFPRRSNGFNSYSPARILSRQEFVPPMFLTLLRSACPALVLECRQREARG